MLKKPLFIPLHTLYYDQFASGEKKTERRIYGKRWNHKTCFPGRAVVISKGYGKAERLSGTIIGTTSQSFSSITCHNLRADLLNCYGQGIFDKQIISIQIKLNPEEHEQPAI